jgi:hypothetical protein
MMKKSGKSTKSGKEDHINHSRKWDPVETGLSLYKLFSISQAFFAQHPNSAKI